MFLIIIIIFIRSTLIIYNLISYFSFEYFRYSEFSTVHGRIKVSFAKLEETKKDVPSLLPPIFSLARRLFVEQLEA